jgi:alpha-tubulin suppressor-like RCC1 family protein
MNRSLRNFLSGIAALALVAGGAVVAAAPASALGPCTTVCYVDASTGSNSNGGNAGDPFATIQMGIDSVLPNGTVNVRPGNYDETASNRTIVASNGGPSGPYQFGLFVSTIKSGITVQGVTSGDVPITSAAGVLAHVTTNATNNFGYSGVFIEGDNVTLTGLAIGANAAGSNKTIEVIGNNMTLNASDIEDYYGSVYLDDWAYNSGTQTPHLASYNVTNNIFRHGVSLDISSGAGGGTNGGPISSRVISGNTFEGDTNPEGCPGCTTGEVYWPAISFNGAGTTVPWFVDPVGAAAITGNTFGAGDQYIRHRHGAPDATPFSNWASYWTGNTFARAAMATTDGNPANVVSYSYSSSYSFPNVERIGGTIQVAHATGCAAADCDGEITHTPTGGTLLVAAGTYNESVTVNNAITLSGAKAGVDARTRSGNESILAPPPESPAGRTPLSVAADDTTIDGFTVMGNTYVPLVGAGVYLQPGTHGTHFVNNIVRNNVVGLFPANDLGSDPTLVRHNLFKDNTNPGSSSGNDIYADNYTAGGVINGLTIDENTFTNSSFVEDGWAVDMSNTAPTQFSNITVSTNSILNKGRGVLFTGTKDSTVTGNTYTASSTLNHYGVLLWDAGDSSLTNSNISVDHNVLGCAASCTGQGVRVLDAGATAITITRNNVAGFDDGISTTATATVNGTCNWWGAASGPTAGQTAGGGPVTTQPWLFSTNLAGACVTVLATSVATGAQHSCARISDGTARCWGSNTYGQLGDGTNTTRLLPTVVKNPGGTGPLTGVTQIVAGSLHTCAWLTDGTARCWGYNSNGQLGDGTTTNRSLPVVVKNGAGTAPLANVTQITAAVIFTCARISDGTARCWGSNGNGVLGDGTTTNHILPIVVKNPAGTGSLTGVTQISVRGIHSCARISDGTARCWGFNANGQLGDGTTATRMLPVVVKNSPGNGSLTGVAQIAAGRLSSCARLSDGTARCWGFNGNGQLGDGTMTQRLLAVAVKNSAGTAMLTGITLIAPGGVHTCASIIGGTAACWGYNANGQLGIGTTAQHLLPVTVKNGAGTASLTGVTQVSGLDVHSCARLTDGRIWCWGGNANGQLGDGTTTNHLLPVFVPMT